LFFVVEKKANTFRSDTSPSLAIIINNFRQLGTHARAGRFRSSDYELPICIARALFEKFPLPFGGFTGPSRAFVLLLLSSGSGSFWAVYVSHLGSKSDLIPP